jgi:glutathionylspermidine synthase
MKVRWFGLQSSSRNDEAAYVLTPTAVEKLQRASHELHSMALEAVDFVVSSDDLLEAFEIPRDLWWAVRASWAARESDFIGRFDFIWDGAGDPKLLEYNADTPTLLVETSVAQQMWMDRIGRTSHPDGWQYNHVHRRLVEGWPRVVKASAGGARPLVVTGDQSLAEESENMEYLVKTAKEGGVDARSVSIAQLSFDPFTSKLTDLNSSNTVSALWKLYPYEWLIDEDIGQALEERFYRPGDTNNPGVQFLEPPWKLVLGNKALIALLWQLFPGHRNLLPASFSDSVVLPGEKWVSKPKFGREGQGVLYSQSYDGSPSYLFHADARNSSEIPTENGSVYIGAPIYQKFHQTRRFSGRQTVIGSWIIYGEPAGLAFREDVRQTTLDSSSFVPHLVASGAAVAHSLVDVVPLQVSPQSDLGDDDMPHRPRLTPAQAVLRAQLYPGTELRHEGTARTGLSGSSNSTGYWRNWGHTSSSGGAGSSGSGGTAAAAGQSPPPSREEIKRQAAAENSRQRARSPMYGFRRSGGGGSGGSGSRTRAAAGSTSRAAKAGAGGFHGSG